MKTEYEVRCFFDKAGEEYENLRYPYMRALRARAINKELDAEPILDIGCNCGHLVSEYISGQKFVGMDISLPCLKKANIKQKRDFINASASALPFKEKIFGSVVCSEVLYYLEDPLNFLKSAFHLLVPGGKLIVLSSNRLYCRIGSLLGVLLKLRPKDINEKTYYHSQIITFLEQAGFININWYGKGVLPVRGFEFLDNTFLKMFGFVLVVTGQRPD